MRLQDRKGEMGRTRTSDAPLGLRRGREMGWRGGMGKGEEEREHMRDLRLAHDNLLGGSIE